MTHNGWTNRETWIVNLWLGDSLAEYVRDTAGEEITTEQARCYVEDCLDSAMVNGLASDLLDQVLDHVSWQEIANAANE